MRHSLLFIVVKYLLNRTMYNEFIQQCSSLINKYYARLTCKSIISKDDFIEFIGLTVDYETLKTL